jgi:hypothetical protein
MSNRSTCTFLPVLHRALLLFALAHSGVVAQTRSMFIVSGNWTLLIESPQDRQSNTSDGGSDSWARAWCTSTIAMGDGIVQAHGSSAGPNQVQASISASSTWRWDWTEPDDYEPGTLTPMADCTLDLEGDSQVQMATFGSGIWSAILDAFVACHAQITNNIGGDITRRLENARTLGSTALISASLEGIGVQFSTNSGQGTYLVAMQPAHQFVGPISVPIYDIAHLDSATSGGYAESGLWTPSCRAMWDGHIRLKSRTTLYQQ